MRHEDRHGGPMEFCKFSPSLVESDVTKPDSKINKVAVVRFEKVADGGCGSCGHGV